MTTRSRRWATLHLLSAEDFAALLNSIASEVAYLYVVLVGRGARFITWDDTLESDLLGCSFM